MKRKQREEQVQIPMPAEIAQSDLSDNAKAIYAILLQAMIDVMNKHQNYSQKEQARYIKLSFADFAKQIQMPEKQVQLGLQELSTAKLVDIKVAYANFKYVFLPGCEKFIEKD